jgi:hypothetical protein
MEIKDLDLEPVAEAAALLLLKKHPKINFTSGRRTVSEQAHAMASNIWISKNRKWIQATYRKSPARDKLQKWVDDHPSVTSVDKIAVGLKTTMNALTINDLSKLSKHLVGLAFDVKPVQANATAIKKTLGICLG